MVGAPTKKSSGTIVFMVISLLLTLVGAGTGFAVGTFLQGEGAEAPRNSEVAGHSSSDAGPGKHGADAGHVTSGGTDSDQRATAEASFDDIDPHAVKAVAFPPVLTTLIEPKGKWIRLEGSVLTRLDAQDPPELLAERSGEQILTYLRSLRLEQLEGPSGVMGLREDLNEMVRTLSDGQVQGVLIHGLVVE